MSALNPSSSGWQVVKRKAKKIGNKVDKIVHNYPKLPRTLSEESLPLKIGSKVSVNSYNAFLDENESSGYKFYRENKNVYIVDMSNAEHGAVVVYLIQRFAIPNNGAMVGPIYIYGDAFHYNPTGSGEKIAADVAIRPLKNYVLRPSIPHPGPPPSDVNGCAHARIVCEVANAQGVGHWNKKCETWMLEPYVRCVFGIKLFPKKTMGTAVHRQMIARLWTREASGRSVISTNTTLADAGVHVTEWDFGTMRYGTKTPTLTDCNASNLDAFRVTVPVSYVFYDPPLVGTVPAQYAVFVPNTVVGLNFVIDLYDVQMLVLEAMK
ncbi:805_t:CDS:2 [Paraglomus brasilianum]|uniref:805_t:CDS:1 n=1 Tax=Paraglomus brasilianum TaxID=144538 RepID=A0A9N9BZ45_9GLOM|nr:805_t:CDS:2 [Paraglomus brasilianum]